MLSYCLIILSPDYVKIIMESFSQLSYLQSRFWPLQISPTKMWLTEGQVQENTSLVFEYSERSMYWNVSELSDEKTSNLDTSSTSS